MKRVPLWKIKRELIRPFRQLARHPKHLLKHPKRLMSYLFGAAYYDRMLAHKVRRHQGAVPVSDRVAVYLIFPNHGVMGSHIAAVDYLRENGYAPLVVSNVPLSESDRLRLLDKSWLVLERPNHGYDFGGYRDGVLAATSSVPNLNRLVLVNDSCWFPIPGSVNWLKEAENLNLDFVGAATNYGHPRVDPDQYREISWNYRSTHRNFHYCSFALMMSSRVLKDPAVKRFWKRFPLSNSKHLTVKRGEIGLSNLIKQRGFSHGTPHDISDLDKMLAALSVSELKEVARNMIVPESPQFCDLKSRVLANPQDRRDLEATILAIVSNQGSSYSLTCFLHDHAGYGFLKKSPIWLNEHASDLTIEFARRLDGDLGETILEEALELRERRAPTFAAPLCPDTATTQKSVSSG